MRSIRLPAIAAAVALVSQSALGITHIWNGGNGFGPDSMNLALNWSGGTPVSSSSNLTLVFPGSASSFSPNQNIPSPPLVLQALNQTGGFYTYGGGGFRFANLGAAPTITTTTSATFNTPLDFQAATAWTCGFGNHEVNGALSGSGAVTITGNGSNSFQVGGAGVNTHTGTISFVNFNQVVLNRGGTVTQGGVVIDSSTVYAIVANQFGVNSDLTLENFGFLQANTNQVFRDLTLNGGSSIGTGAVSLLMNGNLSSSSGGNAIGNNALSTLDFNGSPRIISVTSSGTNELLSVNTSIVNGSFVKTGVGRLSIFSGSNSFNAQNVISGGVVNGTADSIGSVNIGATGELRLYGGNLSAPVLFGSGTVEFHSSHLFTVAQSHTGVSDVRGGGAAFGAAAFMPINLTSSDFGYAVFQETGSGTYSGTLSGSLAVTKNGVGTLSLGGINTHSNLTSLQEGGLRILSDTALGTSLIELGGPINPTYLEAVGTRVLPNQIIGIGSLTFTGGGNLHFTNSLAKFANFGVMHNSTGTTTLDGKFTLGGSGVLTVNSGTLVLGNPALVGGFASSGQIIVNGGVLTVRSFNFTTLPDVTLAGGVLNAPNGYAIPLGAALQGNGGVTGRIASANGSSVIANGNLAMGDASHVAGVNLDGELYTSQFAVSLLDANQSVLGSLTQIGTPSNLGTLNAANGVVLNFGRNITGRGTIVSGNTLATASIINGDVLGDSFANYLEFTGYVKGVGNFNNVAFSGTFAPGLSPALLTVGNVILSSSNVLDIELGGMNRGSQFDAFDITGTMKFGGELKLSYINAFSASLGNQFNIFDGATTGSFATFNFPPLANGWQWDTSLLYTQGIVQVVVPEPSMLGMISFGAIALMRRRK